MSVFLMGMVLRADCSQTKELPSFPRRSITTDVEKRLTLSDCFPVRRGVETALFEIQYYALRNLPSVTSNG